jgi:hypothetical protein
MTTSSILLFVAFSAGPRNVHFYLIFLHSITSFLRTFFVLILDCEAIGTAAIPGLLCQARVIIKMIVMECRLAGETEVL